MSHDLIITDHDGEKHGYLVAAGEQNPVLHTKNAPNVPSYGSNPTSPAQAGGLYDVRDTEGDKAITHLDWTLGAGQKSLDSGDANASRFWESLRVDISRSGELRLLRATTETHLENLSGPVYSALGKFWVGTTSGGLSYTSDNGANFTTCSGHTTGGYPVSGMTCDGTLVYLACPAGTSAVYVNSPLALATFTKFGTIGTTTPLRHLAYLSGVLWGATVSGAGTFDSTTGVYTERTTDFLNKTMTSVALVSAGNAVYWVVAQGERSYVYRLTSSVTTTGVVYTTEQYAEFPTGFVATCARGYLSTVYVGGYYASATEGVGKGVVYECSDQVLAPLFEIGEYPEYTIDPDAAENDNRIYALCNASKDLYILTSRAVYRWDIDGTGYSHVFDFPGVGSSELIKTWNPGSAYSWDGTDGGHGAPSYQFPLGWDTVQVTHDTGLVDGVWDYTGGVASYSMPTTGNRQHTIIACTPSGGEALNNATGTTLQIIFGAACAGECMDMTISDGTYQTFIQYAANATHNNSSTGLPESGSSFIFWGWNGSAWVVNTWLNVTPGTAHTLTITMKGMLFSAVVDTNSVASHYAMKPFSSYAQLFFNMFASKGNAPGGGRYFISGPSGAWGDSIAGIITCAIDSITLNSVGAAPSSYITDSVFRPSIAFCKGNLMAPYAAAADNKELTIASHTIGNPTDIMTTVTHHEIPAGGTQIVTITGSSSVPSIDGNWLATRVNDSHFTIPVDVTAGARNTGTIRYNHNMGYMNTSNGVVASGSLTQSVTSFHSGTVLKDFRYIDVSHDPLPEGSGITMSWEIDGVSGNALGVTSGTHTVFTIDAQGYSIKTTLGMTHDTTGTVSPVVRAVNVVWDFVKTKKHQYLLDCRTGAGGGRWDEDSEEAIAFLFSCSDKWATFEDRFVGIYTGSIEEVQFSQANYSPKEGYGGLVRVTVREA